MCPSKFLTVEGVTAATRADAMLLLASQFDEHKVPITGDALDAAVAGLPRRRRHHGGRRKQVLGERRGRSWPIRRRPRCKIKRRRSP